jgi:hypothetical protein
MHIETKRSSEIGLGGKEEGNGQVKDNTAGKGGQKIYRMPPVRAKGAIFAQESAQLL